MNALSQAHEKLLPLVGQEIGLSDWFDIDQTRIDRFASLTEDEQFIHIDPARAAKETPFGDTIAHGFLTLSMASAMAYQVFPALEGQSASINYGFDKIRFVAPVRAGSRIRGRFTLMDVQKRSEAELLRKHALVVEIGQVDKPALVAEWLSLTVF